MRTTLVLDALRMALHQRQPGADVALIHHTDAGSQYTSMTTPRRSTTTACSRSIGSVGDAYDNAVAESFVDSFKTELIADRTWATRSQLELAVVEYVAWFNNERLHEALGDRPPREVEELYAVKNRATTPTDEDWEPTKPSPWNPGRLTSELERQCAPLGTIAGALGHKHSSTTDIYLRKIAALSSRATSARFPVVGCSSGRLSAPGCRASTTRRDWYGPVNPRSLRELGSRRGQGIWGG